MTGIVDFTRSVSLFCISSASINCNKCPSSRTKSQTAETLTNIVHTACLGVQESVNKRQTESGTKDRITTHWVQQVIQMARDQQQDRIVSKSTCDPRLHQRLPKGERPRIVSEIKSDIQTELFQWVISQPAERYDALPVNSGKFSHNLLDPATLVNWTQQFLISTQATTAARWSL